MKEVKLFCLPYAGGSATIFSKWQKYLSPEIAVRPVELAGRGSRFNAPLYKDLQQAVDDVFNLIKGEILTGPYMIYGHSMGSLINYELVQKIRDKHLPGPKQIFFSGGRAPHVARNDEKTYHKMEDTVFKKEVLNLGGTPPELFEYPELMDIVYPILKNDFRIAETYVHQGEIRPFEQDITVFLGKDDELTSEQCHGWRRHTTKLCHLHYFKGGHFFLHDEVQQITSIINQSLGRYTGLNNAGKKTPTTF
ncbi:MAG: thioesterase domain-containing protein [Bacteroidota bacterium]